MATWYSVNKYSGRIETLEVHRETEHTLFYKERSKERRQAKASSMESWFPSLPQAIEHFLRHNERMAEHHKNGLEKAMANIELAKRELSKINNQ